VARSYRPSELPEVDGAEVVRVSGVPTRLESHVMRDAAHAPRVTLAGADVQLAADLWRALPAGELARCHIPSYGLRFFRAGALVVEASLCWECDNAFGFDAAGDELYFEFDATSAPAQDLLRLLAERAG
jgi:hypothetical protein